MCDSCLDEVVVFYQPVGFFIHTLSKEVKHDRSSIAIKLNMIQYEIDIGNF